MIISVILIRILKYTGRKDGKFLRIKIDSPYAVIGDIHGCVKEFEKLVSIIRKEYGEDCLIISAGDTVDRGDYNIETIELCMSMYEEGNF